MQKRPGALFARLRLIAAIALVGAAGLAAGPTLADETSDDLAREAPLASPPARPSPFDDGFRGQPWHTLSLLRAEVAPGDKQRLFLRASESFAGASVEIPVLVMRGVEPGPTLCLTAGVHGDELNGIEVVRKTVEKLSPASLRGMVVAIPVVNLHGFRRSSRYLPDRRDLNRFFPGQAAGSSASRIAAAIFDNVIRRCHALVDFHTGSFHRANLPQVRADLARGDVLRLARAFGVGVVVHNEGSEGTLRRAASDLGIVAITYEAGEPMRFQSQEIDRGVAGVRNVLVELGMLDERSGTEASRVFWRSRWVRVNDGGIFLTQRSLGDRVRIGDELGTVTDPVSNERTRIVSPLDGRIIGMAFSQVVIPGFAAFHIGIENGGPPLASPADEQELPPVSGEPLAQADDQLDDLENPE